jgi:putative redox protein
MAIEMRLNWIENMQFVARSKNGPAIVVDSKDGGGGPTPMELLLVGIAGCTGIDVVLILQKKRLELSKFEININGKQSNKYPKRFTEIHIEYFLAGKNIPFKAVEQAIKLSEEKYCSALASFNAKFSHSYRIENREPSKS